MNEQYENIEVMWLLCKLRPDFKTIADFRKDNTNGLKSVCRDFTLLCKKLNLFGGELVGIDGSKFSAVNHDSRSYPKQKLQQLIKEIDDKIDTYFTRLDNEDTTEETRPTTGQQSLREHIANLRLHKGELEELQKTLEASGETQITLTDPDSRLMRTGKHGNDVCYNVQIAVDAKHKLIVASDLTNEENDLHQLSTMAQAAKDVTTRHRLPSASERISPAIFLKKKNRRTKHWGYIQAKTFATTPQMIVTSVLRISSLPFVVNSSRKTNR